MLEILVLLPILGKLNKNKCFEIISNLWASYIFKNIGRINFHVSLYADPERNSQSSLKGMNSWPATWQNQQQNECAPSEDSDQPGHPPSLIRVFAVRMKKAWILSYQLSAQRSLWSDWADAQADLSLRWAHTHFVGFVMSWLSCTTNSWTRSLVLYGQSCHCIVEVFFFLLLLLISAFFLPYM